MSDTEKSAILAELRRIHGDWKGRFEKEIAVGQVERSMFPSGITFGLSFAIEVVEAGGALPPKTQEEKD